MKNLLFFLLASSLIISCRPEKQSSEMIEIPMEVSTRPVSKIDLTQCDTLLLENSDQGLMYSVKSILFGKNEICVQGQNKVALFKYDGTHIKDLGTKGRGPSEYLYVGNIFLIDDLYYIYDYEGKKILRFDTDGNFVQYETIPNSGDIAFNLMFPFGNPIKYAVRNTFRGVPNMTPNWTIYDPTFKALAHSEEKLRDGSFDSDPFHVWKDEVLYTTFLCDTIYALTYDNKISAKYHLDFGEQTLPGAVNGDSDSFSRAEYWLGEQQNVNRFAAPIRTACQDDTNLYISYLYKGKYNLLCYNKQTGEGKVFTLWDPVLQQSKQYTYIAVQPDYVYFVLVPDEETTDNPLIIRVKSDFFK